MFLGPFGFIGLGVQELVIILAIILLLFGGKKLPELSKSLGSSIKDLRKGFSDDLGDKKSAKKDKPSSSKRS